MAMTAILASFLAAVVLAQAGCLRTQPSSADETAPEAGPPPATAPPTGEEDVAEDSEGNGSEGESPQGGDEAGEEPASSDELQQPLLRELGKALDNAPDLEESERNEAWEILREADPVLTRIKEENRRAIEAANQPPKIKYQRSMKPEKAEEAEQAPDPKEAKEPEA
jgi:hypothetical protein